VVDLLQVLNDTYNTPWLYMVLAFGYAVLVAIVLPIPIEIALLPPLIDQRWGYLTGTALAIAAGKTFGAFLIFVFGLNVEGSVRKWSGRWRFAAGLYLLLSIPLMSDTIPIYVYSVFNQEGKALERNMFLIANFLAALNRVAILGAAFYIGVNWFRL